MELSESNKQWIERELEEKQSFFDFIYYRNRFDYAQDAEPGSPERIEAAIAYFKKDYRNCNFPPFTLPGADGYIYFLKYKNH